MPPQATLSVNLVRPNPLPTILVVEDEELIRMFITEVLQDYNYHVEAAAGVAPAKEILLAQPIDLVFSDINMPGSENGFALERWVRAHFPHTKVLLTSGFPHSAADTRHLLQPLIPKPYNSLSVVKCIQAQLSRAPVTAT